MIYFDDRSYYDVLEVAPDASPQEIRNAYLRSKAAYKKDSVALYTLMSEHETEGLLKEIEEAFTILSNPEKRKEYDRRHGILKVELEASAKVVSIDRVPPMDSASGSDELLVAPSTDITHERGIFDVDDSPLSAPVRPAPTPVSISTAAPTPQLKPAPIKPNIPASTASSSLQQEIEAQTEWSGAFLRKVRETRQIAIEELSDFTKISKTYLLAIENEEYSKLPAAVFLRGFVTQIAKYLRLPHDKVVLAYMIRVSQFHSQKQGTSGR